MANDRTSAVKLPNGSTNSSSALPFIYTQSKARLSGLFDVRQIPQGDLIADADTVVQELFHAKTGLSYSLEQGSVPVFKLPVSYINRVGPIQFYEDIQDLGEQYGVVKVDIIKSDGSPYYDHVSLCDNFEMNTELFWFRARRQFMGSLQNEQLAILKFHEKLYNFHTHIKKHPLNKIPNIDKRTLDLYRLRKCVQLRGGFKNVCDKKLWAQVGRELGYSGRIMSSLSTSLRSAYLKVLVEFDQFEEQELLSGKAQEQHDTTYYLHRDKNCENIYQFASSNVVPTRLRDYKVSKNIKINFNNLTETKKDLTVPNSNSTLPGYDFDFWNKSLEIYDNSVYEKKSSPVYNIKQFYEKSRRHLENVEAYCNKGTTIQYNGTLKEPNKQKADFEALYWRLITDENASFEIDTAIDLNSSLYASNSLALLKENKHQHNKLNSEWKIASIPLSEGSLLRYLNLDIGNYTRTRSDIGMLFSVKNWWVNDHFLPSIDFHQLGSSKLWYVIPPSDIEKFEKLLQKTSSNLRNDMNISSTAAMMEKDFLNSEFHSCYSEANRREYFEQAFNPSEYHDLLRNSNIVPSRKPILVNDSVIHPAILRKYGINCKTVTQGPGSYIFKFPKCYTSNVGSGFYVSSTAMFASESWLQISLESSRWLSTYKQLPGLNVLELLLDILIRTQNKPLKQKCISVLSPLLRAELEYRNKFRDNTNLISEAENQFDYVSSISLQSTGLSKVVIANDVDCVYMSLPEFFDLVRQENDGSLYIFGKLVPNSNHVKVFLHLRYSDKLLESILRDDQAALELFAAHHANKTRNEQPTQLVTELVATKYRHDRIPIGELQNVLLSLSDRSPEYKLMKKILLDTQDTIDECQNIISSFSKVAASNNMHTFSNKGFRIIIPSASNCPIDKRQIESLILRLEKSIVDFPEAHKVFEISQEIESLENEIKMISPDSSIAYLQDIFVKCCCLPVDGDLRNRLLENIYRAQWLQVYNKVFDKHDYGWKKNLDGYTIEDAYEFLRIGTRYCRNDEIAKLEELRAVILRSQETLEKVFGLLKTKKQSLKIPTQVWLDLQHTITKQPLIIDQDISNFITAVVDGVDAIKSDLEPLTKFLNANKPYILQAHETITNDGPLSLEDFSKFDGSETDKRLTIADVHEHKIFQKYVKSAKAWSTQFNQLYDKNKLESWSEKVFMCLDIPSNDDNSSSYCYCQLGDVGSTMVECEICKEWYHKKCINSKKWEVPNDPNTVFICSICDMNSDWILQKKKNNDMVSFESLKELVLSSLQLKIIPERKLLTSLFLIYRKAHEFKGLLRNIMFQNVETLSTQRMQLLLRKAYGSNIELGHDVEILQERYKRRVAEQYQNLVTNLGKIVITGFETVKTGEESKPVTPSLPVTLDLAAVDDMANDMSSYIKM